MRRSGLARSAHSRLGLVAAGTALAVGAVTLVHSPSSSSAPATLDLGGMVAAVANESATSAGTTDYYLKIDGVAGESQAKGHEGQIDVEAFSWGATNNGTATKAGAGRVAFGDFSFAKLLDKASPLIFQFVAGGKHIPTVTLFGVSAGEQQLEYLKITLSDVVISSYQNSGSTGGPPSDNFTVNFAKIAFDYKPQGKDGKLGPAVHGGWDLKANKPV
jgi:type VI secretion system secreted protein Hcp